MSTTAIEWATDVWNPTTGCDRVSPGCANCYALAFAPRLRAMAQARGAGVWMDAPDGGKASGPAFGVAMHPDRLRDPFKLGRRRDGQRRRIFVNSMSDLFHEDVDDDFIAEVWAVMACAPQHDFLILTKRPERMRDLLTDDNGWVTNACEEAAGWVRELGLPQGGGPDNFLCTPEQYEAMPALPNVWLGVSIENRRFVHRADLLRQTPAAVRFISAEPLLGPLLHDELAGEEDETDDGSMCWNDGFDGPELDLTGIDWLIAGGESGASARPVDPQWVRELRDACFYSGGICVTCAGGGMAQHPGVGWSATKPCPACKGRGRGDGQGTAFFFKQWGGQTPKAGGRELDGATWSEFPVSPLSRAALTPANGGER